MPLLPENGSLQTRAQQTGAHFLRSPLKEAAVEINAKRALPDLLLPTPVEYISLYANISDFHQE